MVIKDICFKVLGHQHILQILSKTFNVSSNDYCNAGVSFMLHIIKLVHPHTSVHCTMWITGLSI